MLLNLQQGVLPNVWRYVPFDHVIQLARRLEAKPLSDQGSGSPQVKLFNQGKQSQSELTDEKRTFMDWRRAFAILALIAGRLPTSEELQTFKNKLRAKQQASQEGIVTKKAFISVSYFFSVLRTSFNFISLFRSLHGSISAKQLQSSQQMPTAQPRWAPHHLILHRAL